MGYLHLKGLQDLTFIVSYEPITMRQICSKCILLLKYPSTYLNFTTYLRECACIQRIVSVCGVHGIREPNQTRHYSIFLKSLPASKR